MPEKPPVEGIGPVVAFYGYWPSFHDATIRHIEFDGVTLLGEDFDNDDNTLTISFVLNDMIGETGKDYLSHITLRWYEVERFSLAADYADADQNWLWEVAFSRTNESTETQLRPNDGVGGTILARRVEVIHFQPIKETA